MKIKRNQVENEDSYGIQLNGETQRAPPWPSPKINNEEMFLLPRQLKKGDKIQISGLMRENPQTLVVNLLTESYGAPDYQNIACQIDVRFQPDDGIIYLNTIQNGNPEAPPEYDGGKPSEYFTQPVFNFRFGMTYGDYSGPSIDTFIGDSFFCNVPLKHPVESIRFLTVHGDVQTVSKLDFEFGR